MIFKKKGLPGTLTDPELQQELDRIALRRKRQGWLVLGLLFAGALAGVGLGIAAGLALSAGAAAIQTSVMTGIFAGALGIGASTGFSEQVSGRLSFRCDSARRLVQEEQARRAAIRAAEEERLKQPLDKHAKEAFAASLKNGTENKVRVGKPLTLKRPVAELFASGGPAWR